MAMMMAWTEDTDTADSHKALVLAASSIVTASAASFILGIVMVGVIAVSRRYNVNPDNVATPIAAALGLSSFVIYIILLFLISGDLVTLSLLAVVANFFSETSSGVIVGLMMIYTIILPSCVTVSSCNVNTRDILVSGWTPVLSAMVISSLGGKILNSVIAR